MAAASVNRFSRVCAGLVFRGRVADRIRDMLFTKWLVLLSFSLLTVSSLSTAPAPEESARDRQELGRSLYQSHCGRCHGDDGDATDYYNIIPLAGIARRPPVGLVGRFRQDSFSARGAKFSGTRALALREQLWHLPGRKGFADPGWLWSPYLLNRKVAFLGECRIVDVRDRREYRAGHIPNAVHVELIDIESHAINALPAARVDRLFRKLGIEKYTQVVVYDGTGGPAAAWLWWTLKVRGHPFVAVLDGGWRSWIAEGFQVSSTVPAIRESDYSPGLQELSGQCRTDSPSSSAIAWDWNNVSGSDGLRDAEAIDRYLQTLDLDSGSTFLVDGSPAEASFLVFVLRLLGQEASICEDGDQGVILRLGTKAVE